MENKFYDLHVGFFDEDVIKLLEHFGYSGICIVGDVKDIKKNKEKIPRIKTKLDILTGALVKSKDVKKEARSALEIADLILVSGGDDDTNRNASECWECDILCHPESGDRRDAMDYKNSGLDHAMARFMAERKIALEINFSEIMNSYGGVRSQLIGRIGQNIKLARKYKTPIIIASGASEKFGLRAPRELMAFGKFLGLTEQESKDALTKNPQLLVKKARDRKNPDILLEGLEVVEWGEQEKKKKQQYGWY